MHDLLTNLRSLNQMLEACVRNAVDPKFEPKPENFQELQSLLRLGENLFAGNSVDRAPVVEVEQQLALYRGHLQQLASLVPTLQIKLNLRRQHLGKKREHLRAASAWSQAVRQTTK
ncbi:MAG TPA: hypothetical protein VFA76_02115 [Terriglobales bacterium]|nr:hypothetical protein [Terriglobales bacterium]